MSDAPPKDWHTAAGLRLVQEWSGQDGSMIDITVMVVWADERLRWLSGDKAVETWLAEQAIKAKMSGASEWSKMPAYAQWARTYAEKWNWLVCGEPDMEGRLQRGVNLWDTFHNDDPEHIALAEFKEYFSESEREEFQRTNDARAWKPPTA